jgi:hypothetical protein
MYSTDHESKHASDIENTTELQHMEKPNPTNRIKCSSAKIKKKNYDAPLLQIMNMLNLPDIIPKVQQCHHVYSC